MINKIKSSSIKPEPAIREFTENIQRLYGKNIEKIVLFGSRARGDAGEDSDIDILVITKTNNKDLKNGITDLAFDIILKYGIDIEPVIFDMSEWSRLTKNPTSFTYSILVEGKNL